MRKFVIPSVSLAALLATWTVGEAVQAATEPATSGGAATVRRLNPDQYRRSIEDIFGPGIKIPGRFEPDVRDEGLLAIGASSVAVTPSGMEQYDLKAREIAAQVLAEDRRKSALACESPSPTAFDEACARQFISKYGRLLFRRPLDDGELSSVLTLTRLTAQKAGSFYKGLEFGLARLLVSPNFLFRIESTGSDPSPINVQRLDDYSLATRLSFLLWNATPDAELLDAAEKGELRQEKGLARQVDRLITSPKFEQGVRAFFADMFAFDQFSGLSKDPSIYPKFNAQLTRDAEEQTMLTIVDLLVTRKGDYRDLFTTKQTLMNRSMAALYRVPVDNSALTGWVPYTFAPDNPRAGILTLAAFLMLDPSHEGRSSPTIRGKSVRELFLCQKVPPAPANVDFKLIQETNHPVYKTARERLMIHQDNPPCAGCHAITDPIGLAMENYDAVGEFRTHENGALIDASGKFEGKSYKNVIELQKILRNSPTVPNCVAQRVYEYGTGRTLTAGEREWLKYLNARFVSDRYAFPALMRAVATSKAFQNVSVSNLAANQKH